MSTLDELEYFQLQRVVDAVEKYVAARPAGLGPDDHLLAHFLDNARTRLEKLEQEGDLFEHRDRKDAQRQEIAVLHEACEEIRLNAQEQQMFAGFLQKDYFQRSDFDDLEKFYASAWDRLSDEGKDQMSRRLWEGIRQGEYTFEELPEIVKKKEAERLRELFGANDLSSTLSQIPEYERQAFLRAYDAGDMKTAYELMSRESFKQNVSRDAGVHVAESAVATAKQGDEQKVLEHRNEKFEPEKPAKDALSEIDLAEVDLDALDQVEETAHEQHANLSTPGQGRSR